MKEVREDSSWLRKDDSVVALMNTICSRADQGFNIQQLVIRK